MGNSGKCQVYSWTSEARLASGMASSQQLYLFLLALLSVKSWKSHLTSLSLGFLMHTMEGLFSVVCQVPSGAPERCDAVNLCH